MSQLEHAAVQHQYIDGADGRHMACDVAPAPSDGSEIELVQLGGFEPPASCSTDRRSDQLSHNCKPGLCRGCPCPLKAIKDTRRQRLVVVMMVVVAMTMAVMVVMVAMVMVMMAAENRTVRHNHDLAHPMDVAVVVNMLADNSLVKVESMRSGGEADGERQRGDARKQGLGEHLSAPVGCSGRQMSRPHANNPSNAL
jgi:hypothetical protein